MEQKVPEKILEKSMTPKNLGWVGCDAQESSILGVENCGGTGVEIAETGVEIPQEVVPDTQTSLNVPCENGGKFSLKELVQGKRFEAPKEPDSFRQATSKPKSRMGSDMSSEGQFCLLYSAAKTNHQPGLEQRNLNSKGKAFNVS